MLDKRAYDELRALIKAESDKMEKEIQKIKEDQEKIKNLFSVYLCAAAALISLWFIVI